MSRDRREFTKAQKATMVRRASDAKGRIHCEGCGRDVTGKEIEFDHTIPEGMIIDKSNPLTADDGKLLGKMCCHRGPDGKTAKDVAAIAKAKRREAAHHGIGQTRRKLQGAGFAKASPQKTASRPLTKRIGQFGEQP